MIVERELELQLGPPSYHMPSQQEETQEEFCHLEKISYNDEVIRLNRLLAGAFG